MKKQMLQTKKTKQKSASLIKKDKAQQKIYSENTKFMAEVFLNYARK